MQYGRSTQKAGLLLKQASTANFRRSRRANLALPDFPRSLPRNSSSYSRQLIELRQRSRTPSRQLPTSILHFIYNLISFNMLTALASRNIQLGTCVVCGKESDLRCGECAKYGTELFFCSKSHLSAASHSFLFSASCTKIVRLTMSVGVAPTPEILRKTFESFILSLAVASGIQGVYGDEHEASKIWD